VSSSLQLDQQALLAALWAPTQQNAIELIAARAISINSKDQKLMERGLSAYRANAQALAPKALAGAYPVVLQLLGHENFMGLARQHWQDHPPTRGDLAQWGAQLANHMAMVPGLSEQEPYLSDVARVEWAVHMAALAGDAVLDMASLSILTEQDPSHVVLQVCPGTACVASPYPVVTIVQAHLQPSAQTMADPSLQAPLSAEGLSTGGVDVALEIALSAPSLAQAGQRLRQGIPETALIWRYGLEPRLRVAKPGEMTLLAAFQSGATLLEALAAAPRLDFQAWFAPAVQSGLIVGAKLV
jgi:hypothetical protein